MKRKVSIDYGMSSEKESLAITGLPSRLFPFYGKILFLYM